MAAERVVAAAPAPFAAMHARSLISAVLLTVTVGCSVVADESQGDCVLGTEDPELRAGRLFRQAQRALLANRPDDLRRSASAAITSTRDPLLRARLARMLQRTREAPDLASLRSIMEARPCDSLVRREWRGWLHDAYRRGMPPARYHRMMASVESDGQDIGSAWAHRALAGEYQRAASGHAAQGGARRFAGPSHEPGIAGPVAAQLGAVAGSVVR